MPTSVGSKASAVFKVPGGETSGETAFWDGRLWAKGSHGLSLKKTDKEHRAMGYILRRVRAFTPERQVNKTLCSLGFHKALYSRA